MSKRLSVVIYTRVSSHWQNPQPTTYSSNDAQLDLARSFVRSFGGQIEAAYQEVESVSKKPNQTLRSIIRRYKNIVVVAYEPSRFSRYPADFARIYTLAQRKGIKFATVKDGKIYQSLSEIQPEIEEARRETEIMGRRISDAIRARKERGAFVGSVPPFGYQIVKGEDGLRRLVPVARDQAIIRFIQLMLKTGSSVESMSELLTEIVGEPTKFVIYEYVQRGKKWVAEPTTWKKIPARSYYTHQDVVNFLAEMEIVGSNGRAITESMVGKLNKQRVVKTADRKEVESDGEADDEDDEAVAEGGQPMLGYYFYYTAGKKLPRGVPTPPQEGYVWVPLEAEMSMMTMN